VNLARLLTFDNRGSSLVLTRVFFVNNEIYMAFLLNSQALGVSGKNEQSPWRGAQCSCIGLRPAPRHSYSRKHLVHLNSVFLMIFTFVCPLP